MADKKFQSTPRSFGANLSRQRRLFSKVKRLIYWAIMLGIVATVVIITLEAVLKIFNESS